MLKIKSFAFLLVLFFSTLVMLFTNGCNGLFLNESQAASDLKFKTIQVGIYEDIAQSSVDKDLLLAFFKDYGIKYQIKKYQKTTDLLKDLNSEQLDVGLTRSSNIHTPHNVYVGPSYDDLELFQYCYSKNYSKIYIPEVYKNHHIENELPKKNIVYVDSPTDKLLNQISKENQSCIITEKKFMQRKMILSKKMNFNQKIDRSYSVSWFFAPANKPLLRLSEIWFRRMSRENQIVRFWDQHEAPLNQMSLLEYKKFREDVSEVLPQWKKVFEKYGKKYDIPWTLIAAVAYQESKWDNEARSYTGVRGMMQLTEKTAEHLGVTDRRDAHQSIQGGALYLNYLFHKTPQNINAFDRWIQALAAYNMGWAHIRDLHRLGQSMNKDAYRWNDLKTLLPLKANETYKDQFKFGLARGEETVEFIEKVLVYYQLLNNKYSSTVALNQQWPELSKVASIRQ